MKKNNTKSSGLNLTRWHNQQVIIVIPPGNMPDNIIEITIKLLHERTATLQFNAPLEYKIYRKEIYEKILSQEK